MPEPDRVLQQPGTGAGGGRRRDPAGRFVIGVSVVAPRRDHEGTAPVAHDLDQSHEQLLLVLGETAVGMTQQLDRRGRRETADGTS